MGEVQKSCDGKQLWSPGVPKEPAVFDDLVGASGIERSEDSGGGKSGQGQLGSGFYRGGTRCVGGVLLAR